MIRFEHFSFSYGTGPERQLTDFNFSIAPGEFVLLCGQSACGKTTAAKCINGLIPHVTTGTCTGRVLVKGKDVARTPSYELAKDVGSVFQNPKTQFFNLDSNSELVFGMENLGMPRADMEKRVQTVKEDLNVGGLLNRSVFRLSGGEKQILALASIYAVNPDIYVLDEPTANMDEAGVERLHSILKRLKEMGKTIVISEHRLYFLMDLVDKAVYIDHGQVRRIYTGAEFRSLGEAERMGLGLRCFSLGTPMLRQAAPMEKGFLQVQELTVGVRQKPLLEHLNLCANPGDIVAVIGANGCGKTALLRVLCGLAKEQMGSISVAGQVCKPARRRTLCSMTMQDVVHQLFSDSVREEFSLLHCGASEEEITEILQRMDLLDYRDRHPMTLSGGQKQRLALATAAVSGKEILLLDEPTSGLDYGSMCHVSELIRELAADKLIFIATHDRELENMLCTRELDCGSGILWNLTRHQSAQ